MNTKRINVSESDLEELDLEIINENIKGTREMLRGIASDAYWIIHELPKFRLDDENIHTELLLSIKDHLLSMTYLVGQAHESIEYIKI